MTTVTLYSRPGCHLCEEARAVLERARGRAPFEIDEINIETDDVLHARYLERIPWSCSTARSCLSTSSTRRL